MEVTVDIGYEQLVDLIKKLPAAKINELKSTLNESFIQEKAKGELSEFQNFLLTAPTMSADQYKQHTADRKHFNAWRTK